MESQREALLGEREDVLDEVMEKTSNFLEEMRTKLFAVEHGGLRVARDDGVKKVLEYNVNKQFLLFSDALLQQTYVHTASLLGLGKDTGFATPGTSAEMRKLWRDSHAAIYEKLDIAKDTATDKEEKAVRKQLLKTLWFGYANMPIVPGSEEWGLDIAFRRYELLDIEYQLV